MNKEVKTKKTGGKSIASDIVKKAAARAKEAEKAAKEKAKQAAADAKAKAKADEEKVNAKHGLVIAAAVEKGMTVAKKSFGAAELVEGLGKIVNKMVSENASVTEMGVSIKKGVQLTEEEISVGLSGVGGVMEQVDDFRSTLKWVIGDFANASPEDKRDRVVAQATKEHGVIKHTTIQTMRVCEAIPFEDRIKGASFTHHQELFNYRECSKKKGYEALVDELKDGAKNEAIMSCAELRERLQALSGKKKDKASKESSNGSKEVDPEEHTFYYINDQGDVKWSKGLNLSLCKSINGIVIDHDDKTVINDKGAIDFQIKELEEEDTKIVPLNAEQPKVDKKAKAEKAKVKKVASMAIPD